ncbi:MAG: hypothetical protein ACOCSD_08215 [Halolamina sp.]
MNPTKIVAFGMATMLLLGGAAAVGAATPADQATGSAASADRAGDGIGPSGGLPDQVPDHVRQIHETIESFLSGSVDHLGGELSELLSGGEADAGDEQADNTATDADT